MTPAAVIPMPAGEVKIYIAPIPATDRSQRRRTEQEVVTRMIRSIFGPDAALCHHHSGQPYIKDSQLNISISHSSSTAAIAVSPTPAGIDIEQPRTALTRTAPRFLSANELACCTSPHRLLQAWTAKEAVFKCAGSPHLLISDIAYPLAGDFTRAALPASRQKFSIAHLPYHDQLIAIATPIVKLP